MKKESRQENSLDILKRDIRNKTAARLYFFYGEEIFLLHHYLEQLQKLLLDPLTEAFNFHKLTNAPFTIQDFLNGVANLPMLAEHTLVWVDAADIFQLPEAAREQPAPPFPPPDPSRPPHAANPPASRLPSSAAAPAAGLLPSTCPLWATR